MSTQNRPLGDIGLERFLTEFWQKKPLLIKQAFSTFPCSLSADELAGFSLDEDCTSRLVEQRGALNWQVKHGPLSEQDFEQQRSQPWTLLVQNVDAMDEEVNALLSHFRFLPNWRVDDVMVSYANEGAGVGPHFDYYDVFLLQGPGKRKWRIGQHCDANSALVPDQDMNILQHFECEQEWIVEQGDLIYIPSQIAHWGESIGESLTYSIGFRAPSHSELLLDCTHTISESLAEDQRYRDGNELISNTDAGRIPNEAVLSLQATLAKLVNDPKSIARWIGEYSTSLKLGVNPEALPLNFASKDDWHNNHPLALSPFNRASYTSMDGQTLCYINGSSYPLSSEACEKICNYRVFTQHDLSLEDSAQIQDLLYHKNLFVLADSD